MSEFNLQIGVVLDPNASNNIKKQLSSLKGNELQINKVVLSANANEQLKKILNDKKNSLEISSVKLSSEAISNLKSSLSKQEISTVISTLKIDSSAISNFKAELLKQRFDINIDSIKLSNNAISDLKAKLQDQKVNVNLNYKVNEDNTKKTANSVASEATTKLLNSKNIQRVFASSDINEAAKLAEAYYSKLGKIVSVQEKFNSSNQLSGFVVSLKNANGELEKLYYSLQKTKNSGKDLSQQFVFSGKNTNNSSAYKQVENLEKIITQYESKLSNFKKVNSNILSGLTQPLEKFETSLNGLKNKSSSVLEVKNNFALLNIEAKKIISSLNNSSSSMQKVDSAIKNLRQADSIIKTLTHDFQKLATQPQSVLNELNKLPSMLQNIRNLESQQGRNSNWANAYKELNTTINNVRNNIKSLQIENSKILSQANQAISNNSISRQMALVQKSYSNIDSNKISPDLKNQLVELTNLSNKLNSSLDDKTKTQGFSKFQQLLPNVKNQLSAIAVEQGKFATNTMKANLSNQMEIWLNKNTAASKMFGSQIQQMISELKTADSVKFNALKNEFQKIQIEAIKAGKLGNVNKIISQYESKLSNFKKINSNILSGLSQPLEKFELSLKGLSNGSSSVLEVKNNFSLLNTEASKIISTLNNTTSSIQKANSSIGQLSQLGSTIQLLNSDFQKLAVQPQNVLSELNKLPAMLQNIRTLESQEGRTANWANAYVELNNTVNSVRTNIQALQAENAKVLSRANQAISSNSIGKQIALVNKNYNQLDTSRIDSNLKSQYFELISLSNKLNSSLSDTEKIKTYSKFQQLLPSVKNQLSALATEQGRFATESMKINLSHQMEEWISKNSAAANMFGTRINQMISELKTADSVKFTSLKNEFQEIQIQARTAGKLGKSFFDTFKADASKFSSWLGMSAIIMQSIQSFRKAIDELREVDTILTEISKTSDLTSSELKQLGNDSFEKASTYGANASDYLYGVQEMYRAGYENADKLAELSTLAQSAGDLDAELANDYLIASDAAYGYGGNVEKLNALLDSQNQINENSLPIWKHIGCRLLLSGKTWGHAIPRTRLYKIW